VPVPTILSIDVTDGIATITWTSANNLNYRLQYKNDLGDVNWNDILPDVPATGAVSSATDAVGSSSQRFYRVLVDQ
jgi:hypothetical protein